MGDEHKRIVTSESSSHNCAHQMLTSISGSGKSEISGRQLYCRKEKSLGVLCTNFLKLYNREGVDLIGLDDAAARLGVERRRIYDVVNILESVGVVMRKQKSQYTWKGFEAIPHALDILRDDGLRQNFCTSNAFSFVKASNENEVGSISKATHDGQYKSLALSKENKREKSLGVLTQNFVKLFLCTDIEFITLENAASTLLGDGPNSTTMRTKVRRLYDIANVFSSMNLIEKTHHPESRRPAFRWLGWRGKLANGSLTSSSLREPNKRTFGVEITNFDLKRQREGSKIDWKSSVKGNNLMVIRPVPSKSDCNENKLFNNACSSKSFVFGPFTPAGDSKEGHPGNTTSKRIPDIESFASMFLPQYRNQALSDLFGHYKEAWRSWYVEVAEKERQ